MKPRWRPERKDPDHPDFANRGNAEWQNCKPMPWPKDYFGIRPTGASALSRFEPDGLKKSKFHLGDK